VFKGFKHSKESKLKMSQSRLGYVVPKEVREKIGRSQIGRKHSASTKNKMSRSHTGIKYTLEARLKMSGANHPQWKGGVTPIHERIRKTVEYRSWREAVFKRDNWTCIWCKQRGGKLQADHIKPFALYPELRFAIDNGRTLCKPCHLTTDTWGYKTRRLMRDH
jgi:hypothetical protein